MKSSAETEKKLKTCDDALGTCNFGALKAQEKYVQALEMYYRAADALHVTEIKLINSEVQLIKLKKKYPNEIIYTN